MTQKEFYKTAAWRRCRQAFIDQRKAIDGGLCQVCQTEPGLIVHHIKWLNDDNCNDVNIALSMSNLRYECQACHNRERDPNEAQQRRYFFDDEGNLVAT